MDLPIVVRLVPAVLLASATALAAKPSRPAKTSPGSVIYVTQQRAFLNRGRANGVGEGMELSLARKGKATFRCKVESVSEHTASCVGGGLRPGDSFQLEVPKPMPEPAQPPAVDSPAQLAARGEAVERAPLEKVEFVASQAERFGGEGLTAEVDLSHNFWTSDTDRTFQSEQLDIDVRNLDLTHGLRLFVSASLVAWTQRPAAYRLPQSGSALLYVRETEVERRESGPLTAAFGRLWPVSAPGVGVIDGLQAGWRFTPNLEVGVFGGSMPDPISTLPTVNRWTLGSYFGWESSVGPSSFISWVRQTGRISLLSLPDPSADVRGQAETELQMRLGDAADVDADVRLGAGSAGNAPGLIELARLDISAKPGDGAWRVSAGARYVGLAPTDFATLGETLFEHRGLHVDGTATYAVGRYFALTVLGGIFRDYDTLLTRAEGGPELTLPGLLGDRSAISVGYLFEYGWWGTRNAYLQVLLQPSKRLRVLARGAYSQDAPAIGTGTYLVRELGAVTSAELTLNRYLFVRLAMSGLVDLGLPSLQPSGLRQNSPAGVTGSLTLGGRL